MTTVIINEKSKKGKIVLDLIKELGIGKIVDESKKQKAVGSNIITLKAINDAYEGNTIQCDDFQDYLQKVK